MARWKSELWAWLWAAQIQFFIAYEAVASAWRAPFDWKRNPISDLAAAECYTSPGDGHPVCSPWRLGMGGSFLATGALMAAGALLAPRELVGRAAKTLLVVGGAGFLIVGLTPHLSDSGAHMTGALLAMVFGNLGLVLAGWQARRTLRVAGTATAVCGLIALVAFVAMTVTQLLWVIPPGPDTAWALSWFGLIERIVVYPTIVGMVVLGAGAIASRPRAAQA
ncbi:MAG: DUF998 domain-containing protein [Segniliparus sp.]|uniref:DUF998 domain-containing protein n=1 Tax=Segniliparus sp. TaxID=2804064 RepID=UPI003F2D928E